MNQLELAYTTAKQCSAISGYDWEEPLKVRCRVVCEQISVARAKTGEMHAVRLACELNKLRCRRCCRR
jgi:hypothetical protein